MPKETEIWRPIPGWPQYQVSNQGRVKRLPGWDAAKRYRIRGGLLKPVPVQSGADPNYRPLYVSLSNGGSRSYGVKIARLVLIAFVGPSPKGKKCVRHLDDEQGNNHLSNLVWGTQKSNAADRIRNGKVRRGATNGNATLTEEQARLIVSELRISRQYRGLFADIARKLGVSYGCVNRIAHRETWKHLTE